MKKKIIYLIRHGETLLNVDHILQGGGVDSDLNEKGILQSVMFYKKYKSIPFKKIYTSQLKRSIQSVESFLKNDIPFEPLIDLNEINYGIKDGKMKSDGVDSTYPFIVSQWVNGNMDAKLEMGESPREVATRLKKAWDLILSRPDEDIILISMHGRAMRILLSIMAEVPLVNMQQFPHNNLGLYLIEVQNNQTTFLKKNDTSHLESCNALTFV